MFNKAISDFTNVKFDAVALLNTQAVSGTNYAIVCYGKTSSETPKE